MQPELRGVIMETRHRSRFTDPDIDAYAAAHSTGPDGVQRELQQITADETGWAAQMQIGDDQAVLMETIVRAMGATRAVEVGTFTGYSALCIARGLAPGGRLLCCDVSEEWTSIGRAHWERAGVADRIELVIAPAVETLSALPADETIDLAFIDADKPNYPAYFEQLVRRLRPNGLLLVDNVLWGGRVVDESADDDNTVAIRAFNDLVAADPRVDAVMLPVSDGLTLLRKR
jgi:caffeoyl-CoA O-methyltransferase